MEWIAKRLLMLLSRTAELVGWNRLEFWCYDFIIDRDWCGFDTFIRLDDDVL